MAYTAGVFTPSQLGTINVMEQDLVATSRMSELKKDITSGLAILANQDITVDPIYSGAGTRCISAKVWALRSSTTLLDVSTYAASCNVSGGAEMGTEALTLTKTVIGWDKFKIMDNQCNNSATFDQVYAYGMLQSKIKIEQQISQKLISMAVAGADVPSATWFETAGTVVGNSYNVTAANFTTRLFADISAASKISDIYDPIVLNGRNFFNDNFMEMYKNQFCCTNNDILVNPNANIFFDLNNMPAVSASAITLVIDRNALLFWSSPEYTNLQPVLLATDTYAYSSMLPRLKYNTTAGLQDIYVDIKQTRVCVSGLYGWEFELVVKAGVSLNLQNNNGKQGILKITKV